jgi:hypothetical protein
MSSARLVSRRSLLKAAAAASALSLPGMLRAETQTTLRFIPVIDLTFVDPIYATAQVSRNHGFMAYDTLYGMNSALEVSPQMVSGHVVSNDDRHWDLTRRSAVARRRARAGARLRREHSPLGRPRRLWRRTDGGDRRTVGA